MTKRRERIRSKARRRTAEKRFFELSDVTDKERRDGKNSRNNNRTNKAVPVEECRTLLNERSTVGEDIAKLLRGFDRRQKDSSKNSRSSTSNMNQTGTSRDMPIGQMNALLPPPATINRGGSNDDNVPNNRSILSNNSMDRSRRDGSNADNLSSQ